MKYYIAADGGGTKIISILYDESLNVINTVTHHGVGINNDMNEAEAELKAALAELIPPYVNEIEAFDYSIVAAGGIYEKVLASMLPVRDIKFHTEGETPIAASGAVYGIVAQAGTGSDAFSHQPSGDFAVGGWGFVFGDEGSGYDIGLKSIKAAIYAYDGRGEKTMLLDMLSREWNAEDDFYGIVYKIADPNYRKIIASVTKLTSEAAALGDKVAISIYENAGRELALQVLTAIKRLGGKWEGPIVTSGGAWKGSPHMRRAFDEAVLAEYPCADIKFPIFEPVIGCILARRYSCGESFSDIEAKVCERFSDFIYKTPKGY